MRSGGRRLVRGIAFALAPLALALASTGCARSVPARDALPVTTTAALQARQVEWTRARQLLATLRASEPTRPYVAELTVALHERVSGHGFGARGALAVDPHRALRLILLGPGGATALDLWVTPTRFRLVVPSLDLVRRGGNSAAGTAGLPVAFFRWWFLDPLGGRLLDAHLAAGVRELFVREKDGSTIAFRDIRDPREGGRRPGADPPAPPLVAVRRAPGDTARYLEWSGATLGPRPGDVARYREDHATFGLDVRVRVDALGQGSPDPSAFDDPDVTQPEVSL